jgi:hypothetical protein
MFMGNLRSKKADVKNCHYDHELDEIFCHGFQAWYLLELGN